MNFFKCFFVVLLTSFLSLHAETFSIDNLARQEIIQMYGKNAVQRVDILINFMNTLESKTELEKLTLINDFFNKVNFQPDIQTWNLKDYWATRTEFLSLDDGDCEDYVIAKYFSLVQLGISQKKLFLTYVKAIKYRQSHMVLSYYATNAKIPLILDNINHQILPATQRLDLRPIFNFNVDEVYMAKQRGLGRAIPQGKINLSKWCNLILKIKREKK